MHRIAAPVVLLVLSALQPGSPAAGAAPTCDGQVPTIVGTESSDQLIGNGGGGGTDRCSAEHEGTGLLYVLALEQTAAVQETAHLVATLDPELKTNAGPPGAMDVTWDPEQERLWAVCDDSCDGVTVTLELDDAGAFGVTTAYDRPLGMPNLNNEGLALAPQSACVAGTKEVVWSDDGDTDGHSLRSGTIGCEVPTPTPTPTPTTAPTPTPTTAPTPTTGPTTPPTTSAPTTLPTQGTLTIAKAGKGKLKSTVGEKTKLVLDATATAGAPTGDFVVKLGGFTGELKATLKANGELVIRVPELAKVGRRTLKVTYLGDDLHPSTTRKFNLRVMRVSGTPGPARTFGYVAAE